MNKVYIVEKGFYSDKTIIGVYATKEEAEIVIAELARRLPEEDDYYRFKEYEVGKPSLDKDKNYYLILYDEEYKIIKVSEDDEFNFNFEYYLDGYSYLRNTMVVPAYNEQHAIKIASDRLAELKYRKEIGLA